MNHTDIEEQQILDRYVMRKLPVEEAERFEKHFLSCPECLERLQLAESMQRGFKRAAGQDTARLAAARQLAVVAWLSRLSRSRQMAVLAMALLAVAVLPVSFTLRELARERSAAGLRHAGEVGKLRAELDANRRDLAAERQAHTAATEQLAQARQPQGNVPILFLDAERGGAGEPTVRLRLPRVPTWIVLALTLEPPHQPSYRAALLDAHGREIWRGGDLRPDERDSLSVSLPSILLAPGDYTIAVEGLVPGGKPITAGRFDFRVLPAA